MCVNKHLGGAAVLGALPWMWEDIRFGWVALPYPSHMQQACHVPVPAVCLTWRSDSAER